MFMTHTGQNTAHGRFTLDGSDTLERHLTGVCERVLEGVLGLLGPRRLAGLVLGGGYGRGEGGVLKSSAGDRPYNDLEFYVYCNGNRVLNDWLFRKKLATLGEELSPSAGLHVEFKIDSLPRLRASPVSMFSYDLLSAHRVLFGTPDLFAGCEHHLDATSIPLAEATRLLFNRCTGLLLAREILDGSRAANPGSAGRSIRELTPAQSDFVARNIAKAQLALGDAVLAACKQYHWSCLQRGRCLATLRFPDTEPLSAEPTWLIELHSHHQAGIRFKLHPLHVSKTADELTCQYSVISSLAQQVWLWLENSRLARQFSTPSDYALAPLNKCSDTNPWRNFLLNVRTFGYGGILNERRWRYPRERLLNALPLLLWNGELEDEPRVLSHLQKELHTTGDNWPKLVAAYKEIWPSYG